MFFLKLICQVKKEKKKRKENNDSIKKEKRKNSHSRKIFVHKFLVLVGSLF